MGSGGQLTEKPDKSASPQECLDYLDELCSYALSIGMSYDQYWYGDPSLIKYYVKAEKIRQKKTNNELWLQGFYVYHAVGSLVPILNPFSKEKKAKKYLKEPIPLTEEDKEEQEQQKLQRFINYMDKLAEVSKK